MSKRTSVTTLRVPRALVEGADRFRRKYPGHDTHWVLVHWARQGAIKDGVDLAPSDDHADRVKEIDYAGQGIRTRVNIRIDADVMQAAGDAERDARRGDRTRHWWLVHWLEVGATLDGVQLFDVDGTTSRGWGHGFEFGDRAECDMGVGSVVAVGPDTVTVELDRGGPVSGAPESFRRVTA